MEPLKDELNRLSAALEEVSETVSAFTRSMEKICAEQEAAKETRRFLSRKRKRGKRKR